MLIVNKLSFKRSDEYLFKNVDFSAVPRKIIQIRGRNGIGKTTLIKILANIMHPTTGTIYWNGKNIKKNTKEFYDNLTFIMDNNTSKDDMTVYENIQFWKNLFSSPIEKNEIESLLDMLKINYHKNTLVKFLSYGERRKLEISRLVIEKKKLWIFDEPYIGLDDETISIFNETLRNHVKANGIVVFSSHFHLEIRGVETIDLEEYA